MSVSPRVQAEPWSPHIDGIEAFKLEQLAALTHQTEKISAAHTAVQAMMQSIDAACLADNILRQRHQQNYCAARLCYVNEWESNQPANLKVSLEVRTNFDDWTVQVGFELFPAQNQGSYTCQSAAQLKIVQDSYASILDALLDPIMFSL